MATRTAKRAKPKTQEARPEIEAPVGWAELLQEAIEKTGMISAAFRQFHNYSLGNALLVMFQCAGRGLEIGPIAPYSKWVSLGRQVKKGSSALTICMPKPVRFMVEDKETGEKVQRQIVKFTYRRVVFVLSQTEPIDGKVDRSATLDALPSDWSADRAMAALDVTLAPFSQLDGNCLGAFNPETRTLMLNPVDPTPERTLTHELAHSILHPSGYDSAQGYCEFQAEAVAMLVSHALGLGGMAESRGYCQHWLSKIAGQFELTDENARKIFAAAQKIIAAGRSVSDQEEDETEAA